MSALLLDFLKEDLDPRVQSQLDSDENLKKDAMKYLDDLLVNEQLLSPESFSSSSVSVKGSRTLIEEMAELDSQARQIDDTLAKYANENRDLLVETSQSLKTISAKLGTQLDSEISTILYNISSMKFDKKSSSRLKTIEEAATSTSLLYDIDSILDILELPSLCKLCICQGNYQEALEISVMVKMLIIKFPNIEIFRKIEKSIKSELRAMVKGLIKLLNTNLKQSNILKIFQILNRPDLIEFEHGDDGDNTKHSSRSSESNSSRERFLKMIYLNSRFKFITDELATLKPLVNLKKITYLKRYIETYREHVANSLSLYHTIFNSVSARENGNKNTYYEQAFVKKLATILTTKLREHFSSIGSGTNETSSDIKSQKDGVVLQAVYLCKSLDKFGLNFESMLTQELCMAEPILISQEDWGRNVAKVLKSRS